MPLSEKTRIEVYLPDLPGKSNEQLVSVLQREFTHSFGGCTIVTGLDGDYLSRTAEPVRYRMNLLWTDAPFSLTHHRDRVSEYVDSLRESASQALDTDTVMVAVFGVAHSE